MRVLRLLDPCVNLTSSHLSRKQSEAQKLCLPKGKKKKEGTGLTRRRVDQNYTWEKLHNLFKNWYTKLLHFSLFFKFLNCLLFFNLRDCVSKTFTIQFCYYIKYNIFIIFEMFLIFLIKFVDIIV